MLFSEPKIPQSRKKKKKRPASNAFQCSSASRKFLNVVPRAYPPADRAFQCSSASRKFLNETLLYTVNGQSRFSALQRAENSSIIQTRPVAYQARRFSALQRAENSSRVAHSRSVPAPPVSVLFSEPKIPQASRHHPVCDVNSVSVLFSEPKIPQLFSASEHPGHPAFQCSSASRKFLNGTACHPCARQTPFQCSSASRKFLNMIRRGTAGARGARFSALQRAENSSMASRPLRAI